MRSKARQTFLRLDSKSIIHKRKQLMSVYIYIYIILLKCNSLKTKKTIELKLGKRQEQTFYGRGPANGK